MRRMESAGPVSDGYPGDMGANAVWPIEVLGLKNAAPVAATVALSRAGSNVFAHKPILGTTELPS